MFLASLHWSKNHSETGAFFPPALGLSIGAEESPSPDTGILPMIIPCGMSRINATYWSHWRGEMYILQEVLFVTPQAFNLSTRHPVFLLQSKVSKLLPACPSGKRNSNRANKNVQKSLDDFQIRPATNWNQRIIPFMWMSVKIGIPHSNCRLEHQTLFSLFSEVQVGCI